jgi:RimJ/RimL family protein N-acetyltransferase
LPPDWQGAYSHQRAERWIRERDAESTTLIVIQKATGNAIGLLILFGTADGSRDLRLGYLLAEAAWGQGFASELVRGLVDWSTANDISTLTGGVESGNIASRRVLEKNGFVADLASNGSDEQMFVLKIS